MKLLKKFESFSRKQNNIDYLLDKISNYGIESLTKYELKVLDNGGTDIFDEEYKNLSKKIINHLNAGFFIKVDVKNIPTFFNILDYNGIKTYNPNKIEWEKWGNKFYFVLTTDGLKHDNKEPNQDTFYPTFPDKNKF